MFQFWPRTIVDKLWLSVHSILLVYTIFMLLQIDEFFMYVIMVCFFFGFELNKIILSQFIVSY
jgi:hypothetical protein